MSSCSAFLLKWQSSSSFCDEQILQAAASLYTPPTTQDSRRLCKNQQRPAKRADPRKACNSECDSAIKPFLWQLSCFCSYQELQEKAIGPTETRLPWRPTPDLQATKIQPTRVRQPHSGNAKSGFYADSVPELRQQTVVDSVQSWMSGGRWYWSWHKANQYKAKLPTF